ncbi:MAG TPA: hypothetical protein VE645_05415 [Pseudonocardiaceae bacterium]|nr:hypothetical protein [Pseudonocardiaceae bacterium]
MLELGQACAAAGPGYVNPAWPRRDGASQRCHSHLPRPGGQWHLGEVFIKVGGKTYYL